jgi:hypothetical protein
VYYGCPQKICRKAADGSGEEEPLLATGPVENVSSVSPDGAHLLFGTSDIFLLPLAGTRKPEPWLQTQFTEGYGVFSPDGRWVAYRSNENGRFEIYVQGHPDRRGKWVISTVGGSVPQWRADGKELYWSSLDGMVMSARMALSEASPGAGTPEQLFRLPVSVGGYFYFQMSRDATKFLVWEPEGGEQPDLPMVVIQNWAARLDQ